MSTSQIVERSSALFFFTSAANVAALVGGGALLATGLAGGIDTVPLAGIPIRYLADWTDRVAAGELPATAPARPW